MPCSCARVSASLCAVEEPVHLPLKGLRFRFDGDGGSGYASCAPKLQKSVYAASLTRRASFDRVARLSFLPEPLAAWIIEFHDIPRFSIFIMAVLRVVSSGRPRYFPSLFAFEMPSN